MATVVRVIAKPRYLMLSLSVTMMVIVFSTWLPNLHLIIRAVTSSTISLWQKTNLLASLLGSLQTNFTLLSRTIMVISAILTGVQVSLLVYYLRQSTRIQQEMGVSFAGVATSLLGVGCASCGSVVLTSLIGLSSTTSLLGMLPFKGKEIGLVGIAMLLVAIYLTLKKINQPVVCQIKNNNDHVFFRRYR